MFKNYLKIAYKVLLRRKFFTFISLFGISFSLTILIVANSFFDQIFGSHYPETDLDRTLSIINVIQKGKDNSRNGPISYYFLDKYMKSLTTPEKTSIVSTHTQNVVYTKDKKINLDLKFADSEFWEIMNFNFLEGKSFVKEDVTNKNFVAVINQEIKKKYFNDENAVGKFIELNGKNYRVIGVVENVSFLKFVAYADVWVPISTFDGDLNAFTFDGLFLGMILAKSKSDFSAIKSEFQNKIKNIEFPNDKFDTIYATPESYFEAVYRTFIDTNEEISLTPVFLLIVALITLFLLMPTVNLVNINISRILERSSEIGVRKACGATSWNLINQFLVENLLLTLLGGILGLIFAALILERVNAMGFVVYSQFEINFRVFLFGLAVTIFFGLFSGIYPAYKMSKLNPVEALKGGN